MANASFSVVVIHLMLILAGTRYIFLYISSAKIKSENMKDWRILPRTKAKRK
jgi:hypothetical protein